MCERFVIPSVFESTQPIAIPHRSCIACVFRSLSASHTAVFSHQMRSSETAPAIASDIATSRQRGPTSHELAATHAQSPLNPSIKISIRATKKRASDLVIAAFYPTRCHRAYATFDANLAPRPVTITSVPATRRPKLTGQSTPPSACTGTTRRSTTRNAPAHNPATRSFGPDIGSVNQSLKKISECTSHGTTEVRRTIS